MNGVIYCRVSSKEQIDGTSLESQRLACEEYARSNNIRILKVFVEQGESAKFADRAQLIELLDFCRENKGRVQILLVWKVDRFARNVSDHFNIKASLLKYDVHIVSATEPIASNPEGKLMETILAGFAQFDNDIRATRTVQGMRRRIQEGIFPWKPPVGYRRSTTKGEKKTEPDQPDQPLFGLLQKAWKEFASGAYTKAEIRRLMDSWGVHALDGRPLSPQSVDNFFNNSYYAGILLDPWSGEEHQAQHPAMVSREDFARVQLIVRRGSRSMPHHKERPEFPLRGLVRCPNCKAYMTGSFSRGRSQRYPYYHCVRAKCGDRKSYPVCPVDEEFITFLKHIAPRPELVEKLGEVVVQAAQERQGFLKVKRGRREAESARLNRQIQELIRMRTEGLITDQEFLAQKAIWADRRMALEAAPVHERINPETVHRELDEVKKPLGELGETWQILPPPLQRRFERSVLPVGFVNGQIRTAEKALLFRVFGELDRSKTTAVASVGKSWNQIWLEIQAFAGLVRQSREAKKVSGEAVRRFSRE